MHLNKALVRLVVLAISIPLMVLCTIVRVVGQAPPNQPPPGAYVPIPNYSGVGAASVNAIWVGLNAANEGLALLLFGGQGYSWYSGKSAGQLEGNRFAGYASDMDKSVGKFKGPVRNRCTAVGQQ